MQGMKRPTCDERKLRMHSADESLKNVCPAYKARLQQERMKKAAELEVINNNLTNSKNWKEKVKQKTIYNHEMYNYARRYLHKAIHVLRLMEDICIPNLSEKPYAQCKGHTIYILVNPNSQKYYIGRTGNPRLRERQHIYDAECCKKGTANEKQRTYAHVFMSHTDPEAWCLLPILTNIEKGNINRMEKNIIKQFNPPLNTQYVKDHRIKIPDSWWKHTHNTLGRNAYTTNVRNRNCEKRNHYRKKERIWRAAQSRENKPFLPPGITSYKLERYITTKKSKPMYTGEGKDLLYLISETHNKFNDEYTNKDQDEIHYKITWKRKGYDLTKFKQLGHNFGQCTIATQKPYKKARQTDYDLKDLLNEIKQTRRGCMRLWQIKRQNKFRSIPPKAYRKLMAIITHQHTRKQAARKIPFDDLIHMKQHIKNLSGKRRRKVARDFVHNTIKKRFNITINKTRNSAIIDSTINNRKNSSDTGQF